MESKLVKDEEFYNTVARWYHVRSHKGGKTWFCESDRKFAETLLDTMNEWGWLVFEDVVVVDDDRDEMGKE